MVLTWTRRAFAAGRGLLSALFSCWRALDPGRMAAIEAGPVPQPAQDDRVLDQAEALLDMDGRRGRLEEVVAGLQGGKIQPVDQVTARDRIENRIRHSRTR